MEPWAKLTENTLSRSRRWSQAACYASLTRQHDRISPELFRAQVLLYPADVVGAEPLVGGPRHVGFSTKPKARVNGVVGADGETPTTYASTRLRSTSPR